VTGKLKYIDNNMCMLLEVEENQLKKLPPQFAHMKNGIFIRGSAFKAVYMPKI
jgi:small nuclear ribonucleoprotein (snRNP)-like protein